MLVDGPILPLRETFGALERGRLREQALHSPSLNKEEPHRDTETI